MILFPNCKINLGLHVTAKREDGFHEIETLFYPVHGLRDAVELLPAGKTEFSSTGLAIDCPAEKNLCMRAYDLLKADFPDRVGETRIHLHKHVPLGAGLGGGSADAAAVLKGLNELYELGLSLDRLADYAAKLGSDTVFFLYNMPMLGRGRGEKLTPFPQLDLKGWWLLMVKPDLGVSTAEAYSMLTPRRPEVDLEDILKRSVGEWCEKLVNNFEESVFEKLPQLRKIKEALYDKGAAYASMSGSGSTIYGLFDSEPLVNQDDWRGCFVYSGQF